MDKQYKSITVQEAQVLWESHADFEARLADTEWELWGHAASAMDSGPCRCAALRKQIGAQPMQFRVEVE